MPGSGFKALQVREACLPPVLLVRQPVPRKIRQLAQAHPDNKRSNPKWYPVLLIVSITPHPPQARARVGLPCKGSLALYQSWVHRAGGRYPGCTMMGVGRAG